MNDLSAMEVAGLLILPAPITLGQERFRGPYLHNQVIEDLFCASFITSIDSATPVIRS
jgi:hypothetical protein